MIKVRLDEGYAVDFQDAMSRFTLDSATEFLFGFSVHSMSTGIPYPHNAPDHLKFPPNVNGFGNPGTDAFAKAFLEAQFRISQRIRNGWVWPVNDVFRDQTTESMEVVNRFVEPIVKEAVKKNGRNFGAAKVDGKGGATMDLPAKEREVGEDETLLDHLHPLKEETTNILIAGRDTTMATLTFMFFFLGRYPHILQRLREEIFACIGPTRAPTYDDIKEMRFLRAIINETLRLFPAVPFNIRETVEETVWPAVQPGQQPCYIPAQTQIAYSVFVMHKRKDLWGPDGVLFLVPFAAPKQLSSF
ncbi:cytochrome P450 [Pterulicium gracile]|uniref:Cytochrome P450 n=1 Tax=Pterulicium gracile TaxID=1884261 RepID=A0A5C3Q4V3_9AGAR|nr:cytochrome P450 [Pterula gracilis]